MIPLGVQSLVLGVRLLIVILEPGLTKAINEVAEGVGVLTPPAIQTHGLGEVDMESSPIPAERQLQPSWGLTLVLLTGHDLVRLGSPLNAILHSLTGP